MYYDFDKALDCLSGTILNFDLNNFISKDIVPRKAQHIFMSVLLVKILRTWKLSLT